MEIHRKLGEHGVLEKAGKLRENWTEMSADVRLVPCLLKHAVDDLMKRVREDLERVGHGPAGTDRTRALIKIAAHLISQFCYIQPFDEGSDAVLRSVSILGCMTIVLSCSINNNRFLVAYTFNQVTIVPVVQDLVTAPITPNMSQFEDQILDCLKETNALIANAFGHKLASKPIMDKKQQWRQPFK